MINLKNVTLRRGPHVLLQGVNWTIYQKMRIGIIGSNGTGKTSLFALLMNQLQADVGDLEIPKQLRLAHVAQETPSYAKSALDYVLDGDDELRDLESQLAAAEEAEDGNLMGTLYEKLSTIDAYTAPARAAQLLAGLGFNHDDQQKGVNEFSGGWRVRLNLAKALMCRSDILLLDEPTNHLDLDAVLWLEQWLQKYQGTLLIISHDRDFLDAVVDHIAYMAHQTLKMYTGNYSTFEKTRAAELLLQQAAFEKQQKHLAHIQSYVDRFRYKASKAKQAQSRIKALERMELVSAVQAESEFQFSFRESPNAPNPLIKLESARVQYGDKIVLEQINLSISPKDRLAVLGPNGAGKTSLIRLLAGELITNGGIREPSAGLRIGYFAQHQVDHLKLNETPLEHMRDIAGNTSELDLRKYLGSFGFSGDRVNEPVKNFSGGEKSRLALSFIVWQKPNLLLLDEPTNHLDLEMRNALSLALQEYDGAMILVSHDRFLVRMTTDQLYLVADKKLDMFDGDLNDYQRWLMDFRKKQAAEFTAKSKNMALTKNQVIQTPVQPENLKFVLQKIKKLEQEIEKWQKQAVEIENKLADLSLYEPQNKEVLKKHLAAQAKSKSELERLENEWLLASEERDKLA